MLCCAVRCAKTVACSRSLTHLCQCCVCCVPDRVHLPPDIQLLHPALVFLPGASRREVVHLQRNIATARQSASKHAQLRGILCEAGKPWSPTDKQQVRTACMLYPCQGLKQVCCKVFVLNGACARERERGRESTFVPTALSRTSGCARQCPLSCSSCWNELSALQAAGSRCVRSVQTFCCNCGCCHCNSKTGLLCGECRSRCLASCRLQGRHACQHKPAAPVQLGCAHAQTCLPVQGPHTVPWSPGCCWHSLTCRCCTRAARPSARPRSPTRP